MAGLVKTTEIHQGWVRIEQGKVSVTISPRGILHSSKAFHGDEADLIACIRAAQSYIKKNVANYKKRGVPW